MKHGLLVFLLLSLAGVAALVWVYPAQMLSPGPLIPAHAAVAGLADDCLACHTPFKGVEGSRCTQCHAIADIGLRRVAGTPIPQTTPRPPFHQGLSPSDCLTCHTDHPAPALVPAHSHTFAHALLTPATAANCAGCHAPPQDSLHPDPKVACNACHTTVGWKTVTLDHSRFFALTPPHDAACTTCHIGGDLTKVTCFGCHAHQEADLIRRHLSEGIRNIDRCAACHHSAHGEGEEGGEGGREEGDD